MRECRMTTGASHGRSGSGSIVVGVHDSDASRAALRWAVAHARRTRQHVQVLISWDYPDSDEPDNDEATRFRASDQGENAADVLRQTVEDVVGAHAARRIKQMAVRGLPAMTLVHAARHAALLVIGRGDAGEPDGLPLGSVCRRVVAQATCPVVIVPAPPM